MQCMQALESIWNCNDHFASIVRLFDCGIGGNSSTITIVLIFVFVFFLQRPRPTTCYTVSDGAFVVNAKSWWWNRCRRWIVTFSHFRMLSTTKKSYGKMSCSMPLPLVLRRHWIFSYDVDRGKRYALSLNRTFNEHRWDNTTCTNFENLLVCHTMISCVLSVVDTTFTLITIFGLLQLNTNQFHLFLHFSARREQRKNIEEKKRNICAIEIHWTANRKNIAN